MDIETLTLLKLIIAAGLALLSFKKARNLMVLKQTYKRKQQQCMLIEIPVAQKAQIKEESCLSTSAVSKKTVSNEEYSSVYKQHIRDAELSDKSQVSGIADIKEGSQFQESFIDEIEAIEPEEGDCLAERPQNAQTLLDNENRKEKYPVRQSQIRKSFNFSDFLQGLRSKRIPTRLPQNKEKLIRNRRTEKKKIFKLRKPQRKIWASSPK